MSAEKEPKKIDNSPKRKRWLSLTALFLLAVICLGILGLSGAAVGLEMAYRDKFYPGVNIDSLAVGGKTKAEVLNQLNALKDKMDKSGIKFSAKDKSVSITPTLTAEEDPDFARELLSFDFEKSLEAAFALGRSGNWQDNFLAQAQIYFSGKNIPLYYILDEKELINILQTAFLPLAQPPINAQLKINGTKVEVIEEQSGYLFDFDRAISQFKNNIKDLKTDDINIDLVYQEPSIKKEAAEKSLPKLESVIALAPLKLKGKDQEWEITKEKFITILEFQLQENDIEIALNQEKVTEFLKDIATEIDIEPQDARFQMKDNKVTEFQAAVDGQAVDLEITYKNLNDQILAGNNLPVELVVKTTKAKTSTADANELGIVELIGRGKSNFKGSPVNRRHNIATGAKILNGIIIEPDEEFSTIKALGAIDGEHGFKQELVIKGNRTVPEYGGGLCQIGTTVFRAALNTGLPITQRRNHSYRVTYYEPAGLDATIYDPQPDLRFLNDTGKHILFTTRIDGDNLIFDFYGTKDGRQAVISPNPPKISNITNPGEPKLIETDTLKPGEKKKVETAHKGADTYFKYTVTYPDGTVKEKEFTSHYVPWPEVWLVGKTASTTDAAAAGTVEGAATENSAPAAPAPVLTN
jgi:vancomycin resistance protein YoaR